MKSVIEIEREIFELSIEYNIKATVLIQELRDARGKAYKDATLKAIEDDLVFQKAARDAADNYDPAKTIKASVLDGKACDVAHDWSGNIRHRNEIHKEQYEAKYGSPAPAPSDYAPHGIVPPGGAVR